MQAAGFQHSGGLTNFDWIPDQDHCSVAATALQCMLFDTSKEEVVPLPTWPKEWNVDFKLHACGGIVVEGSYVDGELSLSKYREE